MLVLSRKATESVIIDGCIKVTVVKIDGNKVRLAFEAPPEVRIDRAEIHEARQQFIEVDAPELVAAN